MATSKSKKTTVVVDSVVETVELPEVLVDAPTVYVPERLIQIAEKFNMVRMVDVAMATDTPDTIAFRSYLGANQIRGGDALVFPNRAPDVETVYGRWWVVDDGTIVGHPVGVSNLLYRLSDTESLA